MRTRASGSNAQHSRLRHHPGSGRASWEKSISSGNAPATCPPSPSQTDSQRRGRLLLFRDQILQGVHVSAIIARLVNRRFRDEGCMSRAWMIQKAAERLPPGLALSDMFVTME